MTAYRLYSSAEPGRFRLTLAHGAVEQQPYPVFERQQFIRRMSMSLWDQVMFIRHGLAWLRDHAGGFDVFHGLQGFNATVEPALEAKRLGLPAVVKLAGHRADLADKGSWKTWLGIAARRRRRILRLDAIIAISADIRDELLGYRVPEHKIAFIPNGVDIRQFHPVDDASERSALRARLGWKDRPTVMFAGGLNERKRPHLVVQAVARLRRAGADVQAVLAGPGGEPEYNQLLDRTIREGGVEDAIILHGFTPKPAELYRASDFFCLPSRSEGMPNAVLEAAASGLPTLVTDISGSRDVVRDGVTGRLVEPEGASIAEAVRHYLDHPTEARTHGQAARELAVTRFGTPVVLDQHEALFRRIMR